MENNTLCNRHSLGVNNHTKMYVTYTRIYGWSDYGGESSYQPGYRLENMMWMTLLVYDYIIPGEEQNHLQKLVEENHIKDSWTFVGFKSNPYKYVKNADLYVCSSRKEGFSTAVTESLIVGTPVVSTNCSGTTELLGYNNEYGIVTENNEEALYEGIKKMISDKNVFDYYKKQARKRGNKFSTSETVKAVEEMLEEVAAE